MIYSPSYLLTVVLILRILPRSEKSEIIASESVLKNSICKSLVPTQALHRASSHSEYSGSAQ